ncbi:MAG: rod shape-determining protein MreD [Rhodospirillaceae bacterium]|jgi:rod shape-determining protein MreD|nr:rod shape-determining protein MreD [Rhodospirillaceae bacterium]MBT5898448.1 rod shape-determining protein MreD [Rhodospirillaceae bacterium]MBT6430155.1 rod shape-determining protein MreD [Rhodospirillaceae bacterium]MBT7756707.1 rod shape-determining protein MreD [Rhodospirillaceae bacterium]
MAAPLTNKVANFGRSGIPFAISVLLILTAILPYGLPKSSLAAPVLALISVYYWSVFRPELMPAGAAFLLGLMVDVLSGGPPGLNALILIIVHWAASGQRRALAGKSFAVGWLGYLLIAAGAAIINWFVASLFHATVIESVPLLVSHAIGTAAYPLVAIFLARMQPFTQPV